MNRYKKYCACTFCGKVIRSDKYKNHFNSHMKYINFGIDLKNQCTRCTRVLSSNRNLNNHLKMCMKYKYCTQDRKKFICKKCNIEYKSLDKVIKHKCDERKIITCKFCSYFTRDIYMKLHMKKCHLAEYNQVTYVLFSHLILKLVVYKLIIFKLF